MESMTQLRPITNPEERARELLRELGLMTDDGTPFYQEDLQACITFATSVQAEARDAGFKDGAEWKRISAQAIREATLEEVARLVKRWNFMACSDADGLVADIRALAQAAAPATKEE